MIKSSFKSYALNVAIDGSEDELIHCFKENQPCSAGLTFEGYGKSCHLVTQM